MIDTLTSWARVNPWPTALAVGPTAVLLLYLVARGLRVGGRVARRVSRRTTSAVAMATVGALLATALSANSAWRFASVALGIDSALERAMIFAVGEVTLFTFGLAARANMRSQGRAGAPGVLVWAVCGVLAIPAFVVSHSLTAGLVRLLLGPVAAAFLWHLAMGIELRAITPTARATGLLAVLASEARERVLARFGAVEPDRTAEQIARSRAVTAAAVLAERYHATDPKKARRRLRILHRLQRQMIKAGVATDEIQRQVLLQQRAHLQHAAGPASVPSPWELTQAPAARPVFSDQVNSPAQEGITDPVHPAGGPRTVHPTPEQTVNSQRGPVHRSPLSVNGTVPAWSQQAEPSVRPLQQQEANTPVDPGFMQVSEVNTPHSAPANSGFDDMSIRLSASSPAFADEGVHRAAAVNGEQPLVPAQARPVNTESVQANGAEVYASHVVNADGADGDGEKDDGRLTADVARQVIEAAWWGGVMGTRETARKATRSPSYVTTVFARLEKEHGPRPAPSAPAER